LGGGANFPRVLFGFLDSQVEKPNIFGEIKIFKNNDYDYNELKWNFFCSVGALGTSE